eukprot:TRINITY_DN63455_c0_g1_i1.p1 TRINITY_DN63455_c0_g1~~TRINITY_DN63455_c0_g1_i1.p1  ORF type:complete len:912 (-),score=139.80 TRINITY_DN63455_c0_g1_i1:55-2790(-)
MLGFCLTVLPRSTPVDWTLELCRKQWTVFHVLSGVGFGIEMLWLLWRTDDKAPISVTMLLLGISCAGCGIGVFRWKIQPWIAEAIHVCVLMCMVACLTVVGVASDLGEMQRKHNFAAEVMLKSIPTILGMRLASSWTFVIWATLCNVVSGSLAVHMYNDKFSLSMTLTIIVTTIIFLLTAYLAQVRLLLLYDAQEECIAERRAVDALVPMLCEASIVLDADNDVMLRTDKAFDFLFGGGEEQEEGCEPADRRFSSLVPTGEAHEAEKDRLAEGFRTAIDKPVLLPTTLKSKSGASVAAELLIVNRRGRTPNAAEERSRSDVPSGRVSYLVGLRVEGRRNEEPIPNLVEAVLNGNSLDKDNSKSSPTIVPEQDALDPELTSTPQPPKHKREKMSRSDTQRSCQPPTVTELGFAALARAVDKGDKADVSRRLEKVVKLGRREHWLVPISDLQVLPKWILGSGGFGFVVGARMHGSVVVIKAPLSGQTQENNVESNLKKLPSFLNELRVLRHVRHPNVVLFHGACLDPVSAEIGLVFELIRGRDLDRFLAGAAPLGKIGRYHVMLDVSSALWYLHSQSTCIVHGDLKGSNVMVELFRLGLRAKLIDFGLSRLLSRGTRPLGGSLQWMAPEVIRNPKLPICASSDVFSFGRLIYLVITGKPPLQEVSRDAIVDMAHLGFVPPPTWPEDNLALVAEGRPLSDHCLMNNPRGRPDMAEVYGKLSRWQFPSPEECLVADQLEHGVTVSTEEEPSKNNTGASSSRSTGKGNSQSLSWVEGMKQVRETLIAKNENTSSRPFQEQVFAIPNCEPTPLKTMERMTLEMVSRWNVRVGQGACCIRHAQIKELDRVRERLCDMECECVDGQDPKNKYQCPRCYALSSRSEESRGRRMRTSLSPNSADSTGKSTRVARETTAMAL